jgi:uncharacterized 2Fe-2S/4Fe-4S cluster protein (DUF4445 family)
MSTAPFLRWHAEGVAKQALLQPGDEAGTLAALLARHGFPLNTRCGERGLCSGCIVDLREGALHNLDAGAGISAPAVVRACRTRVSPPAGATLGLPSRSLLRHHPSVVAEFRIDVPWGRDALRPGARYGAAVDIGTTTVAVLLCDLETGAIAARASAFNAQIAFGEDVLTRIDACGKGPAMVAELQRAVAEQTIQPLLAEACAEARLGLRDIGVMAVAGNTTMLHLFAGVDPSPLGVHPFTPVFLEHRTMHPDDAGLDFGDAGAEVHLLPGPAAYVGADLSAGIVATRMLYEDGPTLLVDVGTNGELVAKIGDRLVGCATAAGPAFEGAGLASGIRAVHGAIERIRARNEPFGIDCSLIGGAAFPVGICGSAYVDFLGEARQAGWLLPSGRFSDGLAAIAGGRLATAKFGRRLRVHTDAAGRPIWISEVDISRLLQAKAAIGAGIQTLLAVLGVEAAEVKKLHLAGGFGMHLSVEHAIGCGMLPGFRPDQIEIVGNTALGGAFLALADRNLLAEMSRACAQLEPIELNLQPGFEDAYIDNLRLP